MKTVDELYSDALYKVLSNGARSDDRTGVGTRRVIGLTLENIPLDPFPAITTRKLWLNGMAREVLWILKGSTNVKELVDKGVDYWNIWPYLRWILETNQVEPKRYSDEWWDAVDAFGDQLRDDDEFAAYWGELGPVYGAQWRSWKGRDGDVDQLELTIDAMRTNPHSRRHVMTNWKADEIDEMLLPPCHGTVTQFHIINGNLHTTMYQRSADMLVGVAHNIAMYGLITHMVAHVTQTRARSLSIMFGDAHIYENHIDLVRQLLLRTHIAAPVKLALNADVTEIDAFTAKDILFTGYKAHPNFPELKRMVAA